MTIKPTHARSPAPPRPTENAAPADKTDAAAMPSSELAALSNKNKVKDSFNPADEATRPDDASRLSGVAKGNDVSRVSGGPTYPTMSKAQLELIFGSSTLTPYGGIEGVSPMPLQASEAARYESGPDTGKLVLDTAFSKFRTSGESVDRPFENTEYVSTFKHPSDPTPWVTAPQVMLSAALNALTRSGGSTDFVSRWAKLNPNFEFRDPAGNTTLFHARYGNTFEILVNAGADPTALNKHGISPMMLVANNAPRLDLSLGHGGAKNQAQVNEVVKRIIGLPEVPYFSTGLVYLNDRTSRIGELVDVVNKHGLRTNAETLAYTADRLFNPLNQDGAMAERAEFKEALPAVAKLFTASKPAFEQRVNGETLLGTLGAFDMPAAQAMMSHILDQGADPQALTAAGLPALLDEKKRGFRTQAGVRTLLAHGTSPRVATKEGVTPLMQQYEPKAFEALVQGGAEIEARDSMRNTPLIYQARYGSLANVETLLAAKADVNAVDESGLSALSIGLAFSSKPDIALALVRAGASITLPAAVDRGGRSASIAAAVLESINLSLRTYTSRNLTALLDLVVNKPEFHIDRANPREVEAVTEALRHISNRAVTTSAQTKAKLEAAIG